MVAWNLEFAYNRADVNSLAAGATSVQGEARSRRGKEPNKPISVTLRKLGAISHYRPSGQSGQEVPAVLVKGDFLGYTQTAHYRVDFDRM